MAHVDVNFVESLRHELGDRDGIISFDEACAQVQGQKLVGHFEETQGIRWSLPQTPG